MANIIYKKIKEGEYQKTEIKEKISMISFVYLNKQIKQAEDDIVARQKELKRLEDLKKHLESLS